MLPLAELHTILMKLFGCRGGFCLMFLQKYLFLTATLSSKCVHFSSEGMVLMQNKGSLSSRGEKLITPLCVVFFRSQSIHAR